MDDVKNFEDLQKAYDEMKALDSSFLAVPPPLYDPSDAYTTPQEQEKNLASDFYERLVTRIRMFDQSLDNEHEVGVRLVNFGQDLVFHLTTIGYANPSLIIFKGVTNDGNDPVELIQHISQISILLMKLPRLEPDQPKAPFGFLRTP